MTRRLSNPTSNADARVFSLLLVALLTVVLVGCSQAPEVPHEAPLAAGLSNPQYILTLQLQGDETIAEIEEQTGGQVRVFRQAEYALVGLDEPPLQLLGLLGDTLALDANTNAFVAGGAMAEMNGSSVLWAGGSSVLWAGGSSVLWAGGSSVLWAGGEEGEEDVFAWLPQNTAKWHQIGLKEGQTIASNLGRGVTVAVIDTGVDLAHPALVQGLAPAGVMYDFVDDDAVPQETGTLLDRGYGHGTNVAGVIRQICPLCLIQPIRVLGPDGTGDVADLSSAIDWAVHTGADVINLSLGAGHHLSAVEAALTSAANAGVLVFASSGNTADQQVTYPASAARVGTQSHAWLSITSVDSSDRKSSFATYHPRIELSAPGENVWGPAPALQMAEWSGTSMAAPMAAGAVALALGEELSVDRMQLPELLKVYSGDLYADGLNADYEGKLGDGRLDVGEFLRNVVRSDGSEDL